MVKKILFASLFFGFSFGLASIAQPVKTGILVYEHFTNASCGPCAAYNPALENLLNNPTNINRVTSIKYHTSWPGTDPMHAFNPTDQAARVNYYGVSGVPTFVYGNRLKINPVSMNQATIDNEYLRPERFYYTINTSIVGDSLIVEGSIRSISTLTGAGYRLHLALVEDPINYVNAPGSNGEKIFPNTLRYLLSGPGGLNLGGGAQVANPIPFRIAKFLPATLNQNNLYVTAFAQTNSNNEAYKGVRIKVGYNVATSTGKDEKIIEGMNLFPNPAYGYTNLDVNIVRNEEISYQLYNLVGKMVRQQSFGTKAPGKYVFEIPTSDLIPGVYMVQTKAGSQTKTLRLVVQ